jgi:exoribonuclease R
VTSRPKGSWEDHSKDRMKKTMSHNIKQNFKITLKSKIMFQNFRIASNCNGKKWSAKVAGEQSIDLFLALYLGMKGSMKEEAVVISVMDYSIDVLVLTTGSTHRVYTNVNL